MIGCVGALRLNERLLNAYWLILLGLLVGDVVVGGYWDEANCHVTSVFIISAKVGFSYLSFKFHSTLYVLHTAVGVRSDTTVVVVVFTLKLIMRMSTKASP